MLKHCFSLESFIHKFITFFVPLGIVIFCICKMLFLGSFSKMEFMLAIGQCPLVRESEPTRLLEIPTSPSLYMLIIAIMLNEWCDNSFFGHNT